MDHAQAQAVRALLESGELASLGTLHDGEPFVSMVPFALLADATFLVHVSGLAAHTRDMLAHAGVSVMVTAPRQDGVPAQAVARITVQGDATPLDPEGPAYDAARRAYLARFPQSEVTFGLADFALFAIRPRSARFVGGFAQAKTITADGLRKILGGGAP